MLGARSVAFALAALLASLAFVDNTMFIGRYCEFDTMMMCNRTLVVIVASFKFQVSHVYFMKYSMMGLLHMPNIMGSIEADLYSTYQDILSH